MGGSENSPLDSDGVITAARWAHGRITIVVDNDDERSCLYGMVNGHNHIEVTLSFNLCSNPLKDSLIIYSRIGEDPSDEPVTVVWYSAYHKEELSLTAAGYCIENGILEGKKEENFNSGTLGAPIPGQEGEYINDLMIEYNTGDDLSISNSRIRIMIPSLSFDHTRTTQLPDGQKIIKLVKDRPIWDGFFIDGITVSEVYRQEGEVKDIQIIQIDFEKTVNIKYLPDIPCPGMIKKIDTTAKVNGHFEISPIP